MSTVILLTISNIFMTIAWYGHLKFKRVALWKVILISWLIAFVEYCFQVPANRWGHQTFTAAQLKLMHDIVRKGTDPGLGWQLPAHFDIR